MADDVAHAPGFPPIPGKKCTALLAIGAARAVVVTGGIGRSAGRLAIHLVGSGISHYPAGRRALARTRYDGLLDLVTRRQEFLW